MASRQRSARIAALISRPLSVVLLSLSLCWPATAPAEEPRFPGTYQAEVIRVVDGDTILARVAVWPDWELSVYIRLAGIDAPELAEAGGAVARDFLKTLVEGQVLLLRHPSPGKYARRIIADVNLPDGTNLAGAMVQSGHARPME